MSQHHITVRVLDRESFSDFAVMHARPECQGCFCMYWHFEGDNRLWQLSTPDANRSAKADLVERGATHGLVAYRDNVAVGSVQFEPRDSLPKLVQRMPYRGLTPDKTVWAVTCFRVLQDARRQGVAQALLVAAKAHVRDALGASALESYPRRGDDLRDEELWTGPEGLFVANGFRTVREHSQYPVLRWDCQVGSILKLDVV